jgi:hypothetical protein
MTPGNASLLPARGPAVEAVTGERRCDVCFSPEADLVGGLVVTAIGVDACRHVRRRNSHVLLAVLPLLLGFHQLVEAFVWWGVEGQVPYAIGRAAMWIYLVIAFVVLPVFVPTAARAFEPDPRRRRRMAPFVALGAVVAIVLGVALVRTPVDVEAEMHHLAYSVPISYGGFVVALYVVAVCGAMLFSSYRHVVVFGVANLVAVALLAWLTLDGFTSLWCAYAAVCAGAIALHMRYASPSRERPRVLT